MPDRERYQRQSGETTTIWITKAAREFLTRERDEDESTTKVFDRLLRELRRFRRQAREGGTKR